MELHPSQIPVSRSYTVKSYEEALKALSEMLSNDFTKENGYKLLMPKNKNLARRIGFTIVSELSRGLKVLGYSGNVRYFVYHHDSEHYAIVLVSEEKLSKLSS